MGKLIVPLVVLLLCACGSPKTELPEYTLPAEWEPHEAVWFTVFGADMDSVVERMALALDTSTRVVVLTLDNELARKIAHRWDSLGVDKARLKVIPASPDSGWEAPVARDHAPLFLRKADGTLALLSARWTTYGDHDNVVELDSAYLAYLADVPKQLAQRLHMPVVETKLCMEGGSLEVNGAGTLIQAEAVTLQRNPGWSRDSIETELRRVLGVRHIIWLKQGVAEDQSGFEPRLYGNVFTGGTGGHTDEFVRFVNETTVLLAWPDDADLSDTVQRITRQRMEVDLAILDKSRTADGKALLIVKVPTPDTEPWKRMVDTTKHRFEWMVQKYPDLHHGDTIRSVPATGYLNYLVTNGRVFLPAYWHEGLPFSLKAKDERVRAILQRYFPDRTIVQVDPRALNKFGGGMHCWTHEQPVPYTQE